MKQYELNRAVARVTGESVDTVRHLGFSLLDAVRFEADRARQAAQFKRRKTRD